jgi:preprotein translocase subunit YajC
MLESAFAQTAQSPAGPGAWVSLAPLILVFVVFYFLLIRPQQKKAREHREMLDKLKKNDEVMTSGGIYGRVMALNENIITLEIAPNVRIRVNRAQIAAVVKNEKASAKES